MALMEMVQAISFEAGGDLSADQWKFVTVAADEQVDLETSAGALPTGVLLNNPDAAGKAAEVGVAGVLKVEAAAAIVAGADVACNAAGLAVTATTGNAIVGQCRVGAGAAGELCEVLMGFRGVAP